MVQNFQVDFRSGTLHPAPTGAAATSTVRQPVGAIGTAEAYLDWSATVQSVVEAYGEAIKRLADR